MSQIKIFYLISVLIIIQSRKFNLNIAKQTLKQEKWEFIGKFCINRNQYMKGNVGLQYLENRFNYHSDQQSEIQQQMNNESSDQDSFVNFRIYEDNRYKSQNKNQLICGNQDSNQNEFDKRINLKDALKQMEFKFRLIRDIAQCYVMVIVFCEQSSDGINDNRVIIDVNVVSNDNHPNLSLHEHDYSLFCPLILLSIVLVMMNVNKLYKSYIDDYEPFNYLLLLLTITLVIELCNQSFYYLYFSHLESTGQSYTFYLVSYLVDSVNTQNFIVIILILLIWGFTILENQIEDGDIFIALSLIFIVFTTMISLIEKLVTINNYQYDSDFCSIGCWVIQIFNILFLVYFIYQYDELYIHYNNMQKMVYQRFFRLVFIIGITYLIVVPISKIVIYFIVQDYQRQFNERLFMNVSNWVYLGWMQYQFYSRKSDYFRISTIGLSSQLPIDKYI